MAILYNYPTDLQTTLKTCYNEFIMQSGKKIILGFFIFCSFALFATTVNAAPVSEFSSGFISFVAAIHHNILDLKSDFCNIYLSAVQSGDWKPGELRTKIGSFICNGFVSSGTSTSPAFPNFSMPTFPLPLPSYTPPKVALPSYTAPTATLPKVATPQTSTTNNPGALIGQTNVSGSDLNNDQIIYLTNAQRQQNGGLPPLNQNSLLSLIAKIRVQDMFAKGYFAHISPTGDSVSKEAVANGYLYITIGENIALGNFEGSAGVVTAWMNSPGHRANILNTNYTQIGVSAIQGIYNGSSVWIAAQIFGRPLSDCPAPNKILKAQIDSEKVEANTLNQQVIALQAEISVMNKNDTTAYNAKVAEYNSLVKAYNALIVQLKALIAEYNQEVAVFNTCIQTNP